jgi:3-methylcrotonyl-CoA carboxylase alpha subunit
MSRGVQRHYQVGDRRLEVALRVDAEQLLGTISEDDAERDVEAAARRTGPRAIRLEIDGRVIRASVVRDRDTVWVSIEGRTYALTLEEPGARAAAHGGDEAFAVSPMTGTLAKLSVTVGDEVAEGGELFVVEAMKMEYVVKAPRAVTVAAVTGAVGEQVEQGGVVVGYVPKDSTEEGA